MATCKAVFQIMLHFTINFTRVPVRIVQSVAGAHRDYLGSEICIGPRSSTADEWPRGIGVLSADVSRESVAGVILEFHDLVP